MKYFNICNYMGLQDHQFLKSRLMFSFINSLQNEHPRELPETVSYYVCKTWNHRDEYRAPNKLPDDQKMINPRPIREQNPVNKILENRVARRKIPDEFPAVDRFLRSSLGSNRTRVVYSRWRNAGINAARLKLINQNKQMGNPAMCHRVVNDVHSVLHF